jgi:heavy metal sensor kinase
VVLLVAGLGGWWIAGRALAPVHALTEAAEQVHAAKLDARVPVPAAADEIQRLALVLNEMFARLEGSFTQAQRFAADASHELRTPLTIMRGQVEQMLHTNGLSADQEAGLLSMQEEIHRLGRITEQLLLLARFDAGRVDLKLEQIDLSSLAREACEDAELLATVHEVNLTKQITPGVLVTGDKGQLRRVLLNLLHNATQYNFPGGSVVCMIEATPEGAVASVANTGPSIPAEQRERIFERFYRADPSRTERGGHGLGLSLCREIARAHGGSIVLKPDAQDGRVVFELTLPIERRAALI